MEPSTSKFHDARAYAVLPISPALAALYVSQSSSSTSNTDWCSKCGSYLLDGCTSELRVTRLKSRRRQRLGKRALRSTCLRCGWKSDICVGSAIPVLEEAQPIKIPSAPSSSCLSMPTLSHSPTPLDLSTPTAPPAQSKARNKKKSALQALISRNREKEIQERKTGLVSGGLAAFLGGL